MKLRVNQIFACLLLLSTPLFAEVERITRLIEATTKQLERQRELKADMEQFSSLKKEFMEGKEEKKVGFQMAKIAKKILITAKGEGIEGQLSKTYLDELKFMASLTEKHARDDSNH